MLNFDSVHQEPDSLELNHGEIDGLTNPPIYQGSHNYFVFGLG